MSILELPHTAGCFVCGRDNHHGLQLSLHVDPTSGSIQTAFTPGPQHIGFQGIIHGGVLATAIDEAMVWSAIWSSRRSCVAGEITVRFKQKASVDEPLIVRAKATRVRPRMVETECEVATTDGQIVATATGKYVPLSMEETEAFLETLIDEPATKAAAAMLGLPPSEPDAQSQSVEAMSSVESSLRVEDSRVAASDRSVPSQSNSNLSHSITPGTSR